MRLQYLQEDRISVPTNKLPKEVVEDMHSETVQAFLANLLSRSLSMLAETSLLNFVSAMEDSRPNKVRGRSIVRFPLGDYNLDAGEYLTKARTIEELTRHRLNDRVNVWLIAYGLEDVTEKSFNHYVDSGLLSEAAAYDILSIVKSSDVKINNEAGFEGSLRKETGSEMSIKLAEASMRAFGFKPKGKVRLSDEELLEHDRKMSEHRGRMRESKVTQLTLREAIAQLEHLSPR